MILFPLSAFIIIKCWMKQESLKSKRLYDLETNWHWNKLARSLYSIFDFFLRESESTHKLSHRQKKKTFLKMPLFKYNKTPACPASYVRRVFEVSNEDRQTDRRLPSSNSLINSKQSNRNLIPKGVREKRRPSVRNT